MQPDQIPPQLSRRHFIHALGIATASMAAGPLLPAASAAEPVTRRTPLGFDNFSIRGLGLKAGQVLDYAASLKVDSVFFSDLAVYESHEDGYLKNLKSKADDLGLFLHVGTFSICPTSRSLTKNYGPPDEHLALAMRVAKTLGSPVVRCVLGNSEDRKVEGGIERQIQETVKVLKAVRSRALDQGLKIAVENHAGDMQAWELVTLIEEAGRDFVGATMDSGNATWALEDPIENLNVLAPYAVTTGIRDSAVWETPEGAMVQWTAIGEGTVDMKAYVKRYRELCSQVPFQLEIISGFQRPYKYLNDDFWKPYAKVRARDFARFVALAKRGKPMEPFRVPPGQDRPKAEQAYQKAELERSIRYCRETLGLGTKT